MLTSTHVRPNWLAQLLFCSLLLYQEQLAQGQSEVYYQHTASDSVRGYWRVYTDYNSRMTRVSFYTARHELLYQEKIKDRYVKLTKRTLRQFDELLAKLVDRHLVTDQVKSYDLLASNRGIPLLQPPQPVTDGQSTMTPLDSAHQLTVSLTICEDKKLKLSYLNPAQQQLLITLAGGASNTVYPNIYKAKSKLTANATLFDVSQLSSGTYRFEVDGETETVKYTLVIPEDIGPMEVKRVPPRIR